MERLLVERRTSFGQRADR